MKKIRKSTPQQLQDIEYCEKWLYIIFEGNINDYNECSEYIETYLKEAIQTEIDYRESMEIYLTMT